MSRKGMALILAALMLAVMAGCGDNRAKTTRP